MISTGGGSPVRGRRKEEFCCGTTAKSAAEMYTKVEQFCFAPDTSLPTYDHFHTIS